VPLRASTAPRPHPHRLRGAIARPTTSEDEPTIARMTRSGTLARSGPSLPRERRIQSPLDVVGEVGWNEQPRCRAVPRVPSVREQEHGRPREVDPARPDHGPEVVRARPVVAPVGPIDRLGGWVKPQVRPARSAITGKSVANPTSSGANPENSDSARRERTGTDRRRDAREHGSSPGEGPAETELRGVERVVAELRPQLSASLRGGQVVRYEPVEQRHRPADEEDDEYHHHRHRRRPPPPPARGRHRQRRTAASQGRARPRSRSRRTPATAGARSTEPVPTRWAPCRDRCRGQGERRNRPRNPRRTLGRPATASRRSRRWSRRA